MAAAQREALPDLTDDDVVGSAYCIRNYRVDERLGGETGLAAARDELASRGVGLVLDFVPNHVAPDHPWVDEHPEYFVREDDGTIALGRDPYFPPWPEVLAARRVPAGRAPGGRRGRHVDRRAVRRSALRHGDARARRRVRAHVGGARPRRSVTRRWAGLLAGGDRCRAGGASRLRLLGRGVLGPRAGARRAGIRRLLRQAPVRPARPPRAGRRDPRPPARRRQLPDAHRALRREPRRAAPRRRACRPRSTAPRPSPR